MPEHPLQNRVTPFGAVIATPARGTMYGNRGNIHDTHRRIVRDWEVRRWIVCVLEFRGRRRLDQMPPGRYTGLYFLDEATAFAAGHRPCAECRFADYRRYRDAWLANHPGEPAGADDMDLVLHAERLDGAGRRGAPKRLHRVRLSELPDGAMFAEEDRAYLVLGDGLFLWSPEGYLGHDRRDQRAADRGTVAVLTPPSTIDVMRAGYRVQIHPSASGGPASGPLPR